MLPLRALRILGLLAIAPVVATLCLSLSPRSVNAEDDTPQTPDAQRAALFAWLDALGSPSVEGAPFVRVTTGGWSQQGDDEPEADVAHGFLLLDSDGRFRVLLEDLTERGFEATGPGVATHERVGYRKTDFATYVRGRIATLEQVPRSDESASDRASDLVFGPYLDAPTQTALLAWLSRARGLKSEASALFRHALREHGQSNLRKAVVEDYAQFEHWRFVLAFEDEQLGLLELLRQAARLAARYPESPHKKDIAEAVRILRAMLAAPTVEQEPAPGPARVRWLIDALTTQAGAQDGQPGRVSIFYDPRGEKSPADRLVALGFEAVPELIEAMDDRRFTHMVGYVRDYYFSHHVLRVGDCALDILQVIAGKSFWSPPYFSEHLSQAAPDALAPVRADVRAWWADAREKGERQMLVDAVVRGDARGAYLARRLVQKYPQAARAALLEGIAAADEQRTRGYLVQSLGKLEGESVCGDLEGVMTNDPALLVRVTAALLLLDRGAGDPIGAMTAAWQQERQEDDEGRGLLLEFLAGSGSATAIETLAASMSKMEASGRAEVIRALEQTSWAGRRSLVPLTPAQVADGRTLASPEARAAAEALLVAALADETPDTDRGFGFDSRRDRFSRPRLGDYAAAALSSMYPEIYRFEPGAATWRRNRAIAKIANHWRARQGEPPLPEPEEPSRPRAKAGVVGPLLAAWQAADTPAKRSAVEARLLEVGLGALVQVEEALAALPAESPERPLLGGLARRLSLIVATVRLDPEDESQWGALGAAVQALGGRPLDERGLLACLLAATTSMPKSMSVFRLRFHRDDDGRGVHVRARLEDATSYSGNDFDYGWKYRVNCEDRGNAGGASGVKHMSDPANWADAVAPMKALRAAPTQALLEGRLYLHNSEDR